MVVVHLVEMRASLYLRGRGIHFGRSHGARNRAHQAVFFPRDFDHGSALANADWRKLKYRICRQGPSRCRRWRRESTWRRLGPVRDKATSSWTSVGCGIVVRPRLIALSGPRAALLFRRRSSRRCFGHNQLGNVVTCDNDAENRNGLYRVQQQVPSRVQTTRECARHFTQPAPVHLDSEYRPAATAICRAFTGGRLSRRIQPLIRQPPVDHQTDVYPPRFAVVLDPTTAALGRPLFYDDADFTCSPPPNKSSRRRKSH